ncbi:1001_t:CDS:2 [Entrophospora sp. SA101]|nr:1001_t:CDS:2 [Entrophospora sp. SA101]CAJ0908001.1 1308_t:CDS:2 [Entrophospora sp. SA101]
MKKFVIKECAELISDPIMLRGQDQRIFNHADLPVVKDELSVTLRLKLHSHTSVSTIFHKGTGDLVRTPGLWLVREQPLLYARFTGNWNSNTGIDRLGPALLLNKWYHITYTLSDSEKRLDVYIDGEWTGYYSIQHVKTQKVIFNDGPLYIGRAFLWNGINGEISNFRYFNWRLSVEEVKKDFLKRPIAKGSKIALVHVPTRKYLSSKGVTYPTHNQWMVVCNGQEIDLKNDIWTFIEAHDARESVGGLVYFNTIIGFKHQATGSNLHSHIKHHGVTPKSKHQQVTLYGDVNFDDDWLIRRYSPNASYDDSGSLSHGDIISLFHAMSDKHKLALYSHDILLDDGTQEVACYGNGSDENNKWRIELVD